MVSLIQLHHSSSLQRCQGTTAWGRSPRPRRYSARCPSISPPFGGRKGVREPPGAMVQSLGETLWKPWNCRLNLMIWLMSHDNPMIGPQYVQSKKLSMNNEHDLSIYVYNIYIYTYGGCSVYPLYLSTFMWMFNPLKFGGGNWQSLQPIKNPAEAAQATKMRGYQVMCLQLSEIEHGRSKFIGAWQDDLLTDLDIFGSLGRCIQYMVWVIWLADLRSLRIIPCHNQHLLRAYSPVGLHSRCVLAKRPSQ